jgi:hypothetical protein
MDDRKNPPSPDELREAIDAEAAPIVGDLRRPAIPVQPGEE